ncbi:hypothetical protein, partial [Acinetobacter baumannii]|uniref:hypothetical protein n=1 Tax=Acinetobacter baumannii TaxID=470 RepID=UPI0013D2F171
MFQRPQGGIALGAGGALCRFGSRQFRLCAAGFATAGGACGLGAPDALDPPTRLGQQGLGAG